MQGIGQTRAIGADSDDAAAGSDDTAVLADGGAGMEKDAVGNVVGAADGITLPVGSGITAGHAHHTDGCTGIQLHALGADRARSHSLEQIYDIALQTKHDDLRFGITHAAVILDDLGLSLTVDEAEEDEATIVETFGCQTFDSGADDLVVDLLHPGGIDKRNGRNGPHASGVGTGIALSHALIVFGLGQDFVVAAIGKNEYRAFDATEEFLNDNTRRGSAELAGQHPAQFFLGLVKSRYDQHPLAGTEAVGLENIRGSQRFQKTAAFLDMLAVEGGVCRCRYAVTLHEAFGKVLRSFQLRAGPGRSDHRNITKQGMTFEIIIDAFHQRIFGANNHHVYLAVNDQLCYPVEIVGLYIHILSHGSRSGIAGSDIEFLDFRTLCNLPSQRMLAASASQE